MVTITVCPSHDASGIKAEPQFVPRAKMISKQSRLAFSDELLRQVILVYLEKRNHIDPTPEKSYAERLAAVREQSKQYYIPLKFRLINMQRNYHRACAMGAPQRVRDRLAALVQGVDTEIMNLERGVDKLVSAIAYSYYRMGDNSVQIAEQFGLRSPHVRMIIKRLNDTWFLISGERQASRYAPGGSLHHKPTYAWTEERLRKLFVLRSSGVTFQNLARLFGRSENRIKDAYRRYFQPEKVKRSHPRVVRMYRTPEGGRVVTYRGGGLPVTGTGNVATREQVHGQAQA